MLDHRLLKILQQVFYHKEHKSFDRVHKAEWKTSNIGSSVHKALTFHRRCFLNDLSENIVNLAVKTRLFMEIEKSQDRF